MTIFSPHTVRRVSEKSATQPAAVAISQQLGARPQLGPRFPSMTARSRASLVSSGSTSPSGSSSPGAAGRSTRGRFSLRFHLRPMAAAVPGTPVDQGPSQDRVNAVPIRTAPATCELEFVAAGGTCNWPAEGTWWPSYPAGLTSSSPGWHVAQRRDLCMTYPSEKRGRKGSELGFCRGSSRTPPVA